MKKILYVILAVCLLLPELIYVGHLANIPVATEMVMDFQELTEITIIDEESGPPKNEIKKIPASYTHLGLVESWRTMATSSFGDFLQLAATNETRKIWQASAGDFLGDSLHSTAFFSSSWSFWQAPQGKLNLIGYYQPWLDLLLLIQVAEVQGSYQVEGIGITEPHSAIVSSTPAATAQKLTRNLQQAEQAFQAAVKNPNLIKTMLTTATAKSAQSLLNEYVMELRSKLATDGTGKQAHPEILAWLDAVRTGQIKRRELARESGAWLQQLQPVQLIQIDAEHWLLAAVNSTQTERVLLVQLHVNAQEVEAKEVQIWDAATVGGAK